MLQCFECLLGCTTCPVPACPAPRMAQSIPLGPWDLLLSPQLKPAQPYTPPSDSAQNPPSWPEVSSQQGPSCSPTLVSPTPRQQGLLVSHPDTPRKSSASSPPPGSLPAPLQGLPSPFLRCPSQRLLDRVVRRYAEVADAGSIFMDHFTDRDKLRLLYTLAVNAHPILLQVRSDRHPGRGLMSGSREDSPGLSSLPLSTSLGATTWRWALQPSLERRKRWK